MDRLKQHWNSNKSSPPSQNSLYQRIFRERSHLPNYQAQATQHLAQTMYLVNHIYNSKGKKETIDSLLQGDHKERWTKSISNEFGCLTRGNKHGVPYTNTMEFIPRSDVPDGRDITYASFRFDYRPLKDEPYRTRIVVGGDKLTYFEDPGSPAASLLETKLLLNSVISDAHLEARFLSCDLKDFFLCSFILRYIPADIIATYKLLPLVHKGFVYIKIKCGMHGLKQAAILAFDQLKANLAPYGYYPDETSPGIWQHKTRRTRFCLCVDDFGVKYFNQEDADPLLNAIRQHYKVSVDYEGKNYCGLQISWHYEKRFVDINIPGYIDRLLHKFQFQAPKYPTFSPYTWTPPAYGKTVQYAKQPHNTPVLNDKKKKSIQSIVGSLLY